MNMGGPGDHWLTDLKHWDRPAFGEPLDGILRDILQLGGERLLEEPPWHERLWDTWPNWGRSEDKDAALARYTAELADLRDDLRRDAVARGWEMPDRG
jgi:hypothetical protein